MHSYSDLSDDVTMYETCQNRSVRIPNCNTFHCSHNSICSRSK